MVCLSRIQTLSLGSMYPGREDGCQATVTRLPNLGTTRPASPTEVISSMDHRGVFSKQPPHYQLRGPNVPVQHDASFSTLRNAIAMDMTETGMLGCRNRSPARLACLRERRRGARYPMIWGRTGCRNSKLRWAMSTRPPSGNGADAGRGFESDEVT